jgi:dTDP-4-dehydrorhamnose 3,5-epimerase
MGETRGYRNKAENFARKALKKTTIQTPPMAMLIIGNNFSDHRGTLNFVNDFKFDSVKRFYTISHPDPSIVRAWQGHQTETKHFFVTKGSFLICWVEIDNWDNPSENLQTSHEILRETIPALLTIPPGHANGFKALEPDSTLLVFSDLDLEESSKDLIRFDKNLWYQWDKKLPSQ